SALFFFQAEDGIRDGHVTGVQTCALPISVMMVSEVKYPSFKKFDWRSRRTFPKMVGTILVAGFFLILWRQVIPLVLPILFTAYLVYGFIRPRLSRKMVHDIEEEDEEEEG